jgi:hypothetical protein
MDKSQVLGIVRHILTFGSGFVIAKGWLDESLAAELVTAFIGLAGAVWSVVDKRKVINP